MTGEKRQSFEKKVGWGEFLPIAINPTREEWEALTGWVTDEDTKQFDYLGEKDDIPYVKINVYLKEVKDKQNIFSTPLTFFLQDKVRKSKLIEGEEDSQKTQYVNNVGVCSWADTVINLSEWFIERDYREARVGEEELYTFIRSWQNYNYKHPSTDISMDFKKLIKGNVKELREGLDSDIAQTIVVMTEIKTVEGGEGEEIKEYQHINNKFFLPGNTIRNLRNIKVDSAYLEKLKEKKGSKTPDGKKVYLKNYEDFILRITDKEYGSKNHFLPEEIQPYDKEKNFAASTKVIADDDTSY